MRKKKDLKTDDEKAYEEIYKKICKNKDYKTREEKIYDFMYENRKIIIVSSSIISLIIALVSMIFSNEGGGFIFFFYPLALLCFLLDIYTGDKSSHRKFGFSIVLLFISMVAFILGFFVEM